MQKFPPDDPSSPSNTYFIDVESVAEMVRLLKQDHIVTAASGGPLAEVEQGHLSDICRVLDVACGPGGWVLDVAETYPNMDVVGIDISHRMVAYANAQAQARQLHNASFLAMDATQALSFPQDFFDLVNGRFLVGFLGRDRWPHLIDEMCRITRPGGLLRLTEAETAFTNSLALEHLGGLFAHALFQSGQSFSPDGRLLGITPMLERFLHDTGCHRVQSRAYSVNWSFGQAAHDSFVEDVQFALPLLSPFLAKWEHLADLDFQHLYRQATAAMYTEEFCALLFFLTVWGEVPVS